MRLGCVMPFSDLFSGILLQERGARCGCLPCLSAGLWCAVALLQQVGWRSGKLVQQPFLKHLMLACSV